MKTKGVSKKNHKEMPAGKELEHFNAILLGQGEGDWKSQWPKQPMEVHMSQKEESAIKELIIMGSVKEDFEAGARLTECICKEWKCYGAKAGEAFVLANRTFGVRFQGKKRRKVLMKMLALLVAPIVVLQLRLRCPACGVKIGWQAKLMAPDQCKSCGVFLRSKNASS